MVKKIALICILLIFTVLSVLNGVFQIFVNVISENSGENIKAPELSLKSIYDGSFTYEYEEFFADKFIFRKKFIALNDSINSIKGVPYKDDIEIVSSEGMNVAANLNEIGETANTEWGEILIYDDSAMELFSSDENAARKYTGALNDIAVEVESVVYSILVPTQIEFTDLDMAKELSDSQAEGIYFINSLLNESIQSVNVYDVLKKHQTEYIYMRTDHHWTALGAYYAYTSFMKSKGTVPLELSDFIEISQEGYLGTLYRLTRNINLENNPDVVKAYIPPGNYTYRILRDGAFIEGNVINIDNFNYPDYYYGVFLGGDSPLSIIENEDKSMAGIAIVKDSYANAFIPFLIPHYSEIHVIDPRMFEGSITEYVNDNDIDELLFFNYVLVTGFSDYPDFLN